MTERSITLPDVGEGVTEAEIVEWHVAVGDSVAEDDLLGAVMTDKAAVDIPAPVAGTVLALGGEVGDVLAVGAEYVRLSVAGADADAGQPPVPPEPAAPEPATPEPATPEPATPTDAPPERTAAANATAEPAASQPASRPRQRRVLASPAVRRRAYEHGVPLHYVNGSGPAGRIEHADLDAHLAGAEPREQAPRDQVEEIRVVGLRRQIAERMQRSKARIPHFAYVEELDVTTLEELRERLNSERREDQPKLTLLPFLLLAMVRALREFPQMNALYDDDAGVIRQHSGVHAGVAVQTDRGLLVPVVHHAERYDVWALAAEIARLAEVARAGKASREELTGATITLTSLGTLGGIVSTPVISYPQVAIVGVNRIVTRPVFSEDVVVPRKLMNLSSSFDHRVIDGHDAARFIQRIRSYIEFPSTIFIGA